MYLTWFGANSWLIEIGNQRILLDPWLIGSLVFGNAEWFFKGFRSQEPAIPENIDLILLSQGLPDHAHKPTLQQLDHQIPVVASPRGATVVQELGYAAITSLAFGERFTLNNEVEIKAVRGSVVGYNVVENGYLITELASGFKLYYEPHGQHSPEIKQFSPVDVLIVPIIDLTLPMIGPFIKGTNKALEVAQWLQPQVMLPTTAGGDVEFEGFLGKLQKAQGSIEEFRSLLKQNNLTTQVIDTATGHRVEIQLAGIY
ncbi:MBL fold metallo-hydrolase [Umezakia ovalisporum]|jgi:L-ascorbate metabolism protein UlaG (beta-lactamase superfamily)|uniref:MBL fold metallo-hydrolase n=2 Tax=Umezakia ovalisporum TaxID=75695 RepID=A0AA43GYL9_9CYAN|nr:MBL fold metallo-hydrolase [Umezakia ovalisporum]MBI1242501.1 MBL fold metallo-hydrolase [Nostoc sp. RI_552]MDH6057424.1 MBL fold metallo-hydrolase [Umezakia ovalisporum FSS-43]MDH6064221.1 MBL fold metallo-hydrolase [Umezakia ovalisporum FSS-62]MDH6065936.1 MBL fold metallo-hydrolase [Umezakia ovalisporum APH033B]MDH6070814.1 MBL fold metallo-hydrolase [Umezakia ovalisporum CobakiLakeA]